MRRTTKGVVAVALMMALSVSPAMAQEQTVPVARDDTYRVLKGESVEVDLIANDTAPTGSAVCGLQDEGEDSGMLSWGAAGQSYEEGKMTYRAPTASGVDEWRYTLCAPDGARSDATLRVVAVDSIVSAPTPPPPPVSVAKADIRAAKADVRAARKDVRQADTRAERRVAKKELKQAQTALQALRAER